MAPPEFIYLKPPHGFIDGTKWDKYLGAIVKDCWQPGRDWVPDPVIALQEYDLEEKSYDHFILRTTISETRSKTGAIDRLFRLRNDAANVEELMLRGKRLKSKRILQHDKMWTRVLKRSGVQDTAMRWITESSPNPMRPSNVWWITGVLIAQETEQVTSRLKTLARKMGFEVPIGTAASIAANVQELPITLDGIGDVKVDAVEDKNHSTYFYSKSSKPQIIGLEVRRVDKNGKKLVLVPGQPRMT